MAIQYKLKIDSITENRVRLIDNTGVYNASTNVGGYGTPNADRTDVALLVAAHYKTSKGDKTVIIDAFNPLSSSIFYATIGKDGWYKFDLLNIPIYDDTIIEEYNPGDIVYDVTYNKLYQITDTLVPNVQPPEFARTLVEVNPEDVDDTLYSVASTELFHVGENSRTKLRLNTAITELIFKQVAFSDKQLIRLKDNYNVLRAVLQGAIYEFSRGNKFVAQKNIEFLNTNNYEVY